jgi:hypothetical protein
MYPLYCAEPPSEPKFLLFVQQLLTALFSVALGIGRETGGNATALSGDDLMICGVNYCPAAGTSTDSVNSSGKCCHLRAVF